LVFQNGPIAESGPNGISNEVLLAIVIDRLECFQKGQFACRENALALTKLQEAVHWLHHRTRERLARGVEGLSIASFCRMTSKALTCDSNVAPSMAFAKAHAL
jgi:hypothetical protein